MRYTKIISCNRKYRSLGNRTAAVFIDQHLVVGIMFLAVFNWPSNFGFIILKIIVDLSNDQQVSNLFEDVDFIMYSICLIILYIIDRWLSYISWNYHCRFPITTIMYYCIINLNTIRVRCINHLILIYIYIYKFRVRISRKSVELSEQW